MNRRRMKIGNLGSIALIGIILSSAMFPAISIMRFHGSAGVDSPSMAEDSPILVDGDSGWATVPGITGDGSPGNPYIIKDKVIDAGGSGDGILIQNTSKWFVIRNCTVSYSAAMPLAGIHLVNVTNGLIEQNNCTSNGGGIFVETTCTNITIRGNNATGNDFGIVVYKMCSNVTVVSNNASANVYEGIEVSKNCTVIRVENNSISNNQYEGFLLSYNVTFSDFIRNNISGNGVEGLYVYATFNCTFLSNYISGNQFRGVIISDNSTNNTFDSNNIIGNLGPGLDIYLGGKNNTFVRNNFTGNTGVGLKMFANGDGNRVYLNRFQANGGGNAVDDGAFNLWDNRSAGNYWNDYTGKDGNDDGIGDTAWAILGAAGSSDCFPFWDDGHNPIVIDGNAGWAAFRAAGNCTGSGTAGDPYVIAGIWVNATGITSGIWVGNSTCPFIIKDCLLTNVGIVPRAGIRINNATDGILMGNNCTAGMSGSGILLGGNSTNITVQDNTLTGCGYGIVMWERCANITVTGNNASANVNVGITLSNVTQTVVDNNTANGNGNSGIQVVQTSAYIVVQGNQLAWNTQWGVVLAGNTWNNTVRGCNVTGNKKDGINLAGASPVSNNTITGNSVAANHWNGIYLDIAAVNNIFTGNTVSGNTMSGANLTSTSAGNCFVGNNFTANMIYNAQDNGPSNHWDNGSRGNCWGDYAGADLDDDGIGNPEYSLPGTAGAIDHYPICDDGDDIAPIITDTGLIDNLLFGPAAPAFILTIVEAYILDTAWVSYDNGIENWTCGMNGILPEWDSLANGTIVATFWANDTAGHVAAAVAVTIRRDALAPYLDAHQIWPPGAGEGDAAMFEVNATDTQLDRTWYTIGDDPMRHFFTGTIVTIDAAAWAALPAGAVTITFHANDTLGNEQVVTRTVTKQASGGNGGDLGLYLTIGGGIALAAVAGVIILQKNRRRRGPTPA